MCVRPSGIRISKERVRRLEAAIEEFVPTWSLAPVYGALQALRGVDMIVAVTFVTEIGDLNRFESPRQLMGYLGLVPSERSTGDTVKRGGITKAGNGRVRHMLVESAWTYRHPPRVGAKKLYKLEQTTPEVREIAWKAQTRLTARYRALSAKGKKTTVVCTAIARELVGFMWCVGRPSRPKSLVVSDDHEAITRVQAGGGGPRQGNSRQTLCGRLRPTPAVRQGTPRTHTRNCGSQPAHQSLITDVHQAPPPPAREDYDPLSRAGGNVCPNC